VTQGYHWKYSKKLIPIEVPIQVTEWSAENGYPNIDRLKTCALLTNSGEVLCCVYDFDHYNISAQAVHQVKK